MAMSTGQSLPAVTTEQLDSAIQEYRQKIGRPTRFNPQIAAEVIARLENGETLTAICKDNTMPSLSSVYEWQKFSAPFADGIAQARLRWTHSLNQNALQNLLDTPEDAAMSLVKRNEAIAKHCLELTSRMNPADYAPKQQVQMEVKSVQVKTTIKEFNDLINK